MQPVDLAQRDPVDDPEQLRQREQVPGDVDQHPPPGPDRRIHDVDRGQGHGPERAAAGGEQGAGELVGGQQLADRLYPGEQAVDIAAEQVQAVVGDREAVAAGRLVTVEGDEDCGVGRVGRSQREVPRCAQHRPHSPGAGLGARPDPNVGGRVQDQRRGVDLPHLRGSRDEAQPRHEVRDGRRVASSGAHGLLLDAGGGKASSRAESSGPRSTAGSATRLR